MPADYEELVKRLGYHHEHPVTGKMVLINPDGPKAATAISELLAERDELDFLLHEGGTWEEQLSSAEGKARELEVSIAHYWRPQLDEQTARAEAAEQRIADLELSAKHSADVAANAIADMETAKGRVKELEAALRRLHLASVAYRGLFKSETDEQWRVSGELFDAIMNSGNALPVKEVLVP